MTDVTVLLVKVSPNVVKCTPLYEDLPISSATAVERSRRELRIIGLRVSRVKCPLDKVSMSVGRNVAMYKLCLVHFYIGTKIRVQGSGLALVGQDIIMCIQVYHKHVA